jgi:hypothetical protein
MGMSGAYGGSGGQEWSNARDLAGDLPSGGAGDGGGDGDQAVADLFAAVADALVSEDPDLADPASAPPSYSPAELLPRRAGLGTDGGGGSGGRGVIRGLPGSSGRRGGGSRRTVARGAARGGAVLGAGYALRRGDAAALGDLGLDLTQLRGLSPIRQCSRILDAVLGDGSHPDEHALRKAATAALKEILLSDEAPGEADALRGFVANYIFQLTLVELQAQLDAGAVSPDQAAKREDGMRRWAQRRVQVAKLADAGRMTVARFMSVAAQLAREAIRILRAEQSTS